MKLILDYIIEEDTTKHEVSSLKHLCCLKIVKLMPNSNFEQLTIPPKLAKHLKRYRESETDYIDILYENELSRLFPESPSPFSELQ